MALAILFAVYGFWMSGNGTGTGFFLIWFVLAAMMALCGMITYRKGWDKLPIGAWWTLKVLLILFGISFLLIEGCVVSRMHAKGRDGLDYLIVLGAQVRTDGPSKVLKHRLNQAAAYLEANPDTICILSGGQGYNEPCTEAQGMAEYLQKKGIPQERLILEEKSTTTEQNIQNSKQLIRKGSSVGIITNDFHMFRAMQIAKGEGLTTAEAIAAPSNPWYLPNNMLREYLAEWKYLIRKVLLH